jgi:hypothetical protein
MTRHSPSPVASWLLGRVLPERDRDAVLGDLFEEYALRARSAKPSTVSRWYWGQVCRSIPRMVWRRVREGQWLRTIGVAAGAYIASGTIEFIGTAAISRVFAPSARLLTVLSLVFGLATIMLGGYFAARIRAEAATALAGIVMIAVLILIVTKSGSAPIWYGLAFLIVGPLAALAGGTLYLRRRRGRTSRAV